MRSQENSVESDRSFVTEFLNKIFKVPDSDTPSSISSLIALLNGLLRIKTFTPPTVELMSILKHKRPKLYHATKKSITSTSNLNILFQLDTDPALAVQRLKEYVDFESND